MYITTQYQEKHYSTKLYYWGTSEEDKETKLKHLHIQQISKLQQQKVTKT